MSSGNNENGNVHRNNGSRNNGNGNNGKVQTTGTFTINTKVDSIITKLKNEIEEEQKNFLKKKEEEELSKYYNTTGNGKYISSIKSILNKYLSISPCRKGNFGTNYYLWKGNLKNNNEKKCEEKKVEYYNKIKGIISQKYLLDPINYENYHDPRSDYNLGFLFIKLQKKMNTKLDEKIISHQALITKYNKMKKSSTAGGQKTVKKSVKKPTTKKPITKKTTTKKPVKKPTTKKPVKKTTTKK